MLFYEGKWTKGVVKEGYRHHDGCVSYKLENIGPQEKGFWGCGMSVPTVLLESEYTWFIENPDSYKFWSSKAYNREYNGKTIPVAPISNN